MIGDESLDPIKKLAVVDDLHDHHTMINFQQCKPQPLEIYQMAGNPVLWDISNVAKAANKKREAEERARVLYRRLMALPRDPGLSNNDWTAKAGVSTSFFTNLKGNAKKPPSEPSIGNLRLILDAIGSSLPEFFLHESKGRLTVRPSEQELERAFRDALPEMPPRGTDNRAKYLVEVVRGLLELPPDRLASPDAERHGEVDAPEGGALPRAATK